MAFLAMINNLSTTGNSSEMWKFADDTTQSEFTYKNIYSVSQLQNKVEEVLSWSKENQFRLNPSKCKELRIDFNKHENNNMN